MNAEKFRSHSLLEFKNKNSLKIAFDKRQEFLKVISVAGLFSDDAPSSENNEYLIYCFFAVSVPHVRNVVEQLLNNILQPVSIGFL